MNSDLMTIKEAADYLRVSIDTLRRWDKSGRLPAQRESEAEHRRYRLLDLDNYLLARIRKIVAKWAAQKQGLEPNEIFLLSGQLCLPGAPL